MQSRVEVLKHKSKILKNNPLKDPNIRDVFIYLPASYGKSNKKFPVVYLIAGFTGFGAMNMNVSGYSENIQQRLDRLIKTKKIKEMIVVMPDCFTKYGGSQYVNSAATGRYEDYIIREIVPYIDSNFRTIPKPGSRCIIGKSSGGYGAMWLAMRYPNIFGLMVTHSGDSAFEYCYMKDFPDFVVQIQRYGKGHRALSNFIKTQINFKQPKPKDFFNILNIIGMSACYSPNPKRKEYNFDLPFDIYTAEIIPKIWNRWLKFDPVRLVEKYKRNLKKLKLIFVDCGTRDEFNLQAGARMFSDKLRKNGIKYFHQEFNDGHMNIQYRYDESFSRISKHFSYK
ncbi:MAG: esterase family protein [Chlorobi bacterium]|nr:esterase family protein [Chlorobiota bacterium]MCI0716008.1 esterase family protein [Chlorobiota bacterium]